MNAYEKLGVFYLGRHYDLPARRTLPDLLLYDSNDLLTHALCVGMTGSGKTGLCFDLIEEAALDGIPALLIDPKGDLGNLLLTFPELAPADFEPWIDPDEARKQGLAPAEYAARQAERWRQGLARWDQDGSRIARLRESAEFDIYTPGSTAGRPISILESFAAPPAALLDDPEAFSERIGTTVASLLGLLGVDADAARGREGVFLANLLQNAWRAGRSLDLGALIHEIQHPGLDRIGVMDVNAFYPAEDRFALATSINALLASPGFGAWLEGDPLDIQRLLYTPAGKPRVAIVSIAHLTDPERMFAVTLLLNQVLGWMRRQPGTTSLRALVYMDEIFGFFPPTANPPSKKPLLTLLKQGRAFGLGTIVATQNPVDLDYKGLANIGSWFIGRLQTERDRERVLDGLESAAVAEGNTIDRAELARTLGSLGPRVFFLHNIHEDAPVIFESRWALSYLRGPMTRSQIKALRVSRAPAAAPPPPPPGSGPARAQPAAAPARRTAPGARAFESVRPGLPPAVPQFFVPVSGAGGARLIYQPMLLGAASVRFADAKIKAEATQRVVLLTPIRDEAVPVDWAEAREVGIDPNDLERAPAEGAEYAPLPPPAAQPKQYAAWHKTLATALFTSRKLELLRSPTLGKIARLDEPESEFRLRLQQAAREQRDAAVAGLRARYAPKLQALQDRIRRARQAVERESAQARTAKLSTVLSFGTTLLGAFLGRKVVSSSSLSRAATTLRGVSRSAEQAQDVERAGETLDVLEQRLIDLEAQFEAEAAALEARRDATTEPLETIELRPAKSGITILVVALAWVPHQRADDGSLTPLV